MLSFKNVFGVGVSCRILYSFVGYLYDQLPRLGKRELICLLSFTCNYVVSVRRGLLFLWVLGMGCVILLWHYLSLLCKYFNNCPLFHVKYETYYVVVFAVLFIVSRW